jgi:hypothetical protein
MAMLNSVSFSHWPVENNLPTFQLSNISTKKNGNTNTKNNDQL